MNQELVTYIQQRRAKGVEDESIKNSAILAGWDAATVEAALKADLDAPAPPPPPPAALMRHDDAHKPIAVVNTLTTRGLEYIIMFIALGASAISLALLLHNIVNGLYASRIDSYGSANAYETATLVVSLPIFAILFLRLKAAELKDSTLFRDPSRRRAVQLTLIVTFLVGLFTIIGYIYELMNSATGTTAQNTSEQFGPNLIHLLISLGISGGIFAYYWRDSHRKERS